MEIVVLAARTDVPRFADEAHGPALVVRDLDAAETPLPDTARQARRIEHHRRLRLVDVDQELPPGGRITAILVDGKGSAHDRP